MSQNKLDSIAWLKDEEAESEGIYAGPFFSFTRSLWVSLVAAGNDIDPAWVTGASGFAFRIWVAGETLCPSAMSVFNWKLLPKGLKQVGFDCKYISRMWNEESLEVERREEAHREIVKAVDAGIPPIVWDISVPEWCLIIGYDDEEQAYEFLCVTGKTGRQPYEKLGRNEIPILSVTIPGVPNGLEKEDRIRTILQTAVDHARQREWEERPQYQDGLPAFEVWAKLMEPKRFAEMMEKHGKNPLPPWYYASTYVSMRYYAWRFLKSLEVDDLTPAVETYRKVFESLKAVYEPVKDMKIPDNRQLSNMSAAIRQAGEYETEGVKILESYIQKS
jgi:hypothetical protein